MRNCLRTAALVLVVLLSAGTASAQPSPELSPAEEADHHYGAGKRLFAAKRYGEAIAEFRAALRLDPRPEMLYAIAQAQRMNGDCAGAIDSYHEFLATRPAEDLANFSRANVARCEKELADAPITPPPEPPADNRVALPPPPAPEGRSPWYRDWTGNILTAGGAVVTGAGLVLWLQGRGAASRLNDAPDYQTFVDRRDAADGALTLQRVGVAGMIAGSVLIAGGVVRYATRPGPRRTVAIVPLADGGAVVAAGSF